MSFRGSLMFLSVSWSSLLSLDQACGAAKSSEGGSHIFAVLEHTGARVPF